jgi:hypothetical protein
MDIVVIAGLAGQPPGSHVSGNMLLVMAAVILFVALRMLRQALHPLREVLRALVAAAGVGLLLFLAFALVIGSLIVPR